MELVFLTFMIALTGLLYMLGIQFDSIKKGDEILYYKNNIPVYDIVKSNNNGEMITESGNIYDVWDFIRGNFFLIKKR